MTQQGSADEEKVPVNSSTPSIHIIHIMQGDEGQIAKQNNG